MPSRGAHHHKAIVLLGLCLLVNISESAPKNFDNLLVTNALTSAYSSYVYAFNPNDWKSVTFNTTDFAAKAFFGNFLMIASALAVFSLLPENAFCGIRGTCRGNQGYAEHAYNRYQNRWRNKYRYRQRVDDDYEEVEYIDRIGMPPNVKEQKSKKYQRSKRDVHYSDYDYNDFDSDYVEKDLSTLPAEHRLLPNERQSSRRNPIMEAMVELFFGNPVRRVAQGWGQVYQHYEDYWRFRLRNPGESYRRHLQRKRRKHPNRHHYAQSRVDTVDPAAKTEVQDQAPESLLSGLFVQH